jgi:N-acetylglutamate synthase-like GNAT family acetyltransferase
MITIRSVQIDDLERMYELLCQFVWSTTPSRQAFDANFPEILADPKVYLRVADEGGIVLGYSLAVLQWTLYANGQLVLVQELMVDPERRGRGIGKQLMAQVITDAKQAGAREITVPTRRAKDYYPQFGFTEIAGYFKLKL